MYLIDERELNAIRRVFEKRKLFRYQLGAASECDLFEEEFSRKIGANHSVLLSSGTNALIAALGACGIGPGDEVIIPAYTFAATAAAVIQAGAIPIIANIDETLGISPQEIEEKITDRTRAIIPVHMDGLAADLESVARIARERKLFVIEDCAQALGGSFRGRRLGTWGDFGCFSLNENKHISCGEGGIMVTSRRDFYERAFCIHDNSAQFIPGRKEIFQTISPFVGGSMRVSEITGAIMRVQLERLEPILEDLRARKKILLESVEATRARAIQGACPEGDSGSSFHLIFEDPELASIAGQALRKEELLFAPATTRPAHACWKWMALLGEHASWSDGRNPYRLTDRKYSYNTADFLSSVSILTRTLRMEVDIHASLIDTQRMAEKIQRVLKRG